MQTRNRNSELFLTILATALVLLSQACAFHKQYGPVEHASKELSRQSASKPYENADGECVEDFEVEVEQTMRTYWRAHNVKGGSVVGAVAMGVGALLAFTYQDAATPGDSALKLAGGGALFAAGSAILGHTLYKMWSVPKPRDATSHDTRTITESAVDCRARSRDIASAEESTTSEVEERLRRLKALKDQGLISQDDFDRRQREIIDNI